MHFDSTTSRTSTGTSVRITSAWLVAFAWKTFADCGATTAYEQPQYVGCMGVQVQAPFSNNVCQHHSFGGRVSVSGHHHRVGRRVSTDLKARFWYGLRIQIACPTLADVVHEQDTFVLDQFHRIH